MSSNPATGSGTLKVDRIYDAGSLGCGDGPLLDIAATLRDMSPGAVLEIRSTAQAVANDLPSWCRMTGHRFLGGGSGEDEGRYFVQRNGS